MSATRAKEHPKAHRLSRLAELAHDAGGSEPSNDELTSEKERFLVALARGRALPRKRRPTAWLLAAAAVLTIAISLFVFRRAPAIEYSVTGSRTEGAFVESPKDARAVVHFSEGSEIAFEPDSRGRIAEVSPTGAHVVLEHGAAHVSVQHLPGADWSIEAGPYRVLVIGTEFDVHWSGDALEVDLVRGAVAVKGSVPGGEVKLVSGQRLIARSDGALSVSSLGDAPTAATSDAATPSKPVPSALVTTTPVPVASSSSTAQPTKPSWSDRVASGDYKGVLDEAEARGTENVLGSGPLADVVALGDAARYLGKTQLAKSALESQRSRFHGSSAATSAAFVLGRMSEDSFGDVAGAIRHYDEYLAEAPSGAFAAEALGRKMNAVNRTRGAASARPIATEVLARFPDGAYAPVARQILESP